jgi:hypothetical protein
MLKNATNSDYTPTIVVSLDHMSCVPSTSLGMKTPENTEEDPDDPEPADGDIQMKDSSD